ncbi:MAG: peptidyl-prolyl cis-trans isomerase [Deltaproteobacteria bacterium]|nr:peptidyl-prolyl cis-trans isomerase [Deltaproteobacteria bacterium]MBW1977018.1 peptidyl-prolyl cis-trans isomerase [Deltaproteobacteria bacterium]MBW2044069.1 peptidyl-prolyl cis-trans isomerase [Deltaproteobacteria bacterium]MBW2299090.1 peptidyl-prolyl cis-trans isomerase [Deltaproteobacteria bacterium]
MDPRISRFVFTLVIVCISLLGCDLFDHKDKKIALVIGEREITLEQLKQDIGEISQELDITGPMEKEAVKPMLDRIIDQYLVLEYGRENNIRLSELEFKVALKKIRNGYSEEDFKEMLLRADMDYAEWERRLRERLLIKKVVDEALGEKVVVPFKEIESYFKSHRGEFKRPEMVKFRQVVTRTREEAESVREKWAQGAELSQLIAGVSPIPGIENSAKAVWVQKGELEKSLEKAIFSLKVGEISRVVQSPYGFHVIEVVERRPAGFKDLSESLEEIEARLSSQKRQKLYRDWLAGLRERIPVKVNNEVLKELEIG